MSGFCIDCKPTFKNTKNENVKRGERKSISIYFSSVIFEIDEALFSDPGPRGILGELL